VNIPNPDAPDARPRPEDLVAVGRIGRPHGLKGEVRVFAETGCEPVFEAVERFYVMGPEGPIVLTPWRVRNANRYVIVGFDGYRGRDQAERLREKTVYVLADDLPELDEGDVYQYTQVGARVVDEDGNDLGRVEEVIDSSAHPIFRIAGSKGEFLFPAAPPLVVSEEERNGESVITVRLPEGLIESQTNRTPSEE